MKRSSRLARTAALLATVGLVVPAPVLAQPPATRPQAPAAAPRPSAPASRPITDVSLGEGGLLKGRMVDSQGKPLDGAVITLTQSDRRIAQATTNAQGEFAVRNLKGGVYQVATPQGTKIVRAWAPQTAPPSAKEALVLVAGDPALRGQFGYVEPDDLFLMALGVAGVTLAAIAVAKLDDVESDIDRIERELASP